MKTRTAIRSLLVGFVLMAVSAIAGAQVVDTSGVATVNVQPAITLALVTSPSWGKVVCPPSGTARYSLDYATGTVAVVSGDGWVFNDGQSGVYNVTGAAAATVSYSVSIGSFSGSGITVVSSTINGNSNSGTGTIANDGTYQLKVGGVIDVAANATVASQTATVTVTIDYQ
jgi:hypothetical protein